MKKYTTIHPIRISETQQKTLKKLKSRGFNVSSFIREAIEEKINREYQDLKEKPKEQDCPF